MKKAFIVLFTVFCILFIFTGCTTSVREPPKEVEYEKVEIWNIQFVLPKGYEIKNLEETRQFESKEIYFTQDEEHKLDDYIVMENRKNITEDELLLREADNLLKQNVGTLLDNEDNKELLSLTEFIYRSIPGIHCEYCDEKNNYSTYYFFDTANNIVKVEHVHNKEGLDNDLTDSFENTMNSLEFSSLFKTEDTTIKKSSSKGVKCVNCGGLGYVKQYYGSSWLEAFLAGQPDYELVVCPLCHGTGKTSN